MRPPQGMSDSGAPVRRYGRESLEFGRVVNLSDAVFAIALTLLVFTLDVPDVPAHRLGDELADQLTQLLAFALSFGLVANVWWIHHKFFALLDAVEPGLVALNMILLAAVALVPFPTNLVGAHPTSSASVMPYVAVLLTLTLLQTAMLIRANAVGAWRWPLPAGLFPWLLAGWGSSAAVMVVALALAAWQPVVALALLPLNGIGELLLVRRAPAGYRAWG
jgi:uncharacterized membrane protein